MRLLLDQNMPQPLLRCLTPHDAEHAFHRGWAEMANGNLIAAAEAAGFDVLLTGDRRLRYQQNIGSRRIGIVICTPTFWHVVREHVPAILSAIERAGRGTFSELELPRPALVRRPPPEQSR